MCPYSTATSRICASSASVMLMVRGLSARSTIWPVARLPMTDLCARLGARDYGVTPHRDVPPDAGAGPLARCPPTIDVEGSTVDAADAVFQRDGLISSHHV